MTEVPTLAHMYLWRGVYTHTNTRVSVSVHVRMCKCLGVCVLVWMSVCMTHIQIFTCAFMPLNTVKKPGKEKI